MNPISDVAVFKRDPARSPPPCVVVFMEDDATKLDTAWTTHAGTAAVVSPTFGISFDGKSWEKKLTATDVRQRVTDKNARRALWCMKAASEFIQCEFCLPTALHDRNETEVVLYFDGGQPRLPFWFAPCKSAPDVTSLAVQRHRDMRDDETLVQAAYDYTDPHISPRSAEFNTVVAVLSIREGTVLWAEHRPLATELVNHQGRFAHYKHSIGPDTVNLNPDTAFAEHSGVTLMDVAVGAQFNVKAVLKEKNATGLHFEVKATKDIKPGERLVRELQEINRTTIDSNVLDKSFMVRTGAQLGVYHRQPAGGVDSRERFLIDLWMRSPAAAPCRYRKVRGTCPKCNMGATISRAIVTDSLTCGNTLTDVRHCCPFGNRIKTGQEYLTCGCGSFHVRNHLSRTFGSGDCSLRHMNGPPAEQTCTVM